ncbi:protein regulator of cytokinesis 1-like isoform X2 [Lissotriton helveticus]
MSVSKREALVEESVKCYLTGVQDLWDEEGVSEDQRKDRTDAVTKQVTEHLDRMIAGDESWKEHHINNIAVCCRKLDTLCEELLLPPLERDDNQPILQLEKDLHTKVEVLLQEKIDRQTELRTLIERNEQLCDSLRTPRYVIDSLAVPSLDELDRFRRHVVSLSEEEDRRRVQFVNTQKQIISCMEELDLSSDARSDLQVLWEEEASFCLSTENMHSLQMLLQQLEEQRSQNEAVCTVLRSRVTDLWNKLRVPSEERETFSVNMSGPSGKTGQALVAELQRLEKLERAKLCPIIREIREILKFYWKRCYYTHEQMQAFPAFYDDDYTEDLLELHEAEVVKIMHHFEVHQQLFEDVEKWLCCWDRFTELVRNSRRSTMFYDVKNSGGRNSFTFEASQHAKIHNTFKMLKEDLVARIIAWEEEQLQVFVINEQRFMDSVLEQWQRSQNLIVERRLRESDLKRRRSMGAPRTESDLKRRRSMGAPRT